jgi:hypothetical protein
LSYILNAGKFWEHYAAVDVDGDGHCLLYSILASIRYQHKYNLDIDLTTLKNNIIAEAVENQYLYNSFINDIEGSFEDLLYKYVFSKKYDTSFGDVVPYIIGNALKIGLEIIDNYHDTNNINHVKITDKSLSNNSLIICRSNNHYNAIRPLLRSGDMVYGIKNVNDIAKPTVHDKIANTKPLHSNFKLRPNDSPRCPCKESNLKQKCICSLRCKFQNNQGINMYKCP